MHGRGRGGQTWAPVGNEFINDDTQHLWEFQRVWLLEFNLARIFNIQERQ